MITDSEAVLQGCDYTVISIAGSVVKDPEGIPAGIVLIIRNITNRKRGERALQVANEKISLLSRLTRHDINNQVTAIHGYLILMKENGVSEKVSQYISSCIDLISKIDLHLKFAREYESIGSHQPVWKSLDGMITAAIKELPETKVRIDLLISDVCIYTDPLFEKVIYNLLENALRHGESLKIIQISTIVKTEGDLMLTVKDDGVGIRYDHKELIFSQGFGKNTGLGLSISREILRVTGISINENGVPGEGAKFDILIPAISWRYCEQI